MSKDITSATAKIKLISAVTPAGVNFEQYSADNAVIVDRLINL